MYALFIVLIKLTLDEILANFRSWCQGATILDSQDGK